MTHRAAFRSIGQAPPTPTPHAIDERRHQGGTRRWNLRRGSSPEHPEGSDREERRQTTPGETSSDSSAGRCGGNGRIGRRSVNSTPEHGTRPPGPVADPPTAASDGQFCFAGLVPGRYALLDETGQVLCHLDVDADDPVVEDLTVTPMNRSLP
ncbi:hypothetical protein [Rhodococcus sp. WY5]|uniref:hypothetical protein n=1 Tax=Rhodococcus sp. WY5 TaxID=2708349 RepID=UPI0011C0DF59|nr:hypothetical protein [Rhodococcus sp. WY5]